MNINDYELSGFCPSWINKDFPNDDEYLEIKDLLLFFLFYTPCKNVSARGKDVSVWGTKYTLLFEKIKEALHLQKGKNYDYGNSKSGMKNLFKKYSLKTDFTNTKKTTAIFLFSNNCYESLIKHIRNSIAHSRWRIIDDYYYFEDGSDEDFEGNIYFCVTARIVLSKSDLCNLFSIIKDGPNEDDRNRIGIVLELETLLTKLSGFEKAKKFKRKDAVEYLKIDNGMWKKLYNYGKKEKVMKFDSPYWRIMKTHN